MGPLEAPHPALLAALTALTTIISLLRAWLRHRTTVRVEEEHTRRVRIAVEGSARGQRAEVVASCAELEAASRVRRSKLGRESRTRTVRSP